MPKLWLHPEGEPPRVPLGELSPTEYAQRFPEPLALVQGFGLTDVPNRCLLAGKPAQCVVVEVGKSEETKARPAGFYVLEIPLTVVRSRLKG